MGVGETSLLVTFLAIPVLLDPADGQHRTSSSARVPALRRSEVRIPSAPGSYRSRMSRFRLYRISRGAIS
jgi:hypothetical protein